MARPLRMEFPDAIYHVTSRGNARGRIVSDDVDRARWMRVLDRVVEAYRWRVFAYALMDNHYHLFLQTPEANLSKGMQEINGGYAGYFNARHGRSGHLFQGRFKAVVVESEGHWDALSRYIHLNPVRAGLVSRPEAWAWSSHRGYLQPKARVRWVEYRQVLGEFGGDTVEGRRRYGEFVAAGLTEDLPSPLASAIHGLVLGSETFVDRIQAMLADRPADPDLPELAQFRKHATVADVIRAVQTEFDADPSRWRAGTRCDNLARAVAAYVVRRVNSLSLPVIARHLGYTHPGSVAGACRRIEQVIKSPQHSRRINKLIRTLDPTK